MGTITSCCAKEETFNSYDEIQKFDTFADANAEEQSPAGLSGADTAPEEGRSLPRLPSATSVSLAEGERYTARQLLLMGRYIEAEEQIKELGVGDEVEASKFLEQVMPPMREIAARARLPTEKEGYTKLELSDLNMDIYVRRGDWIDVCFSTDLPATWEKMLAMNWEADLSSQWLPFNPEVSQSYSERASQLLLFVHAKIPMLPGSREAYIHRHVVDCFTPNSLLDGRQGLLVVEKSPDNWKTGGTWMDEFQVKPPNPSRWVTRDEQMESFTFYEYVNPTTIRCFIRYKLNFNVPSWLFPNSALHYLAKFTGRRWHTGLFHALDKFSDFGYQARVDARRFPIYDAVLERALKRSRMDLLGEDGPVSPQAPPKKEQEAEAGKHPSMAAAGKAVMAATSMSKTTRASDGKENKPEK
ncbi:unnamed protein product [Effrenium voratum]|nr:unnamed protein product [Effrenium voratum]|mmetsp:Transcript_114240/g.271947  ORF Transcript_114240/g.271947 Transcript_114240/m.271947 type:complete len:414 (-) Transcript_114240:63-1304(-)